MVEPVEQPQAATFAVHDGEWAGGRARYVANRVIVKLRPATEESPATLDALAHTLEEAIDGGRMLRPPSRTRRVVLGIGAGADPAAVAAELADRDDVEYAEPDLVDRAQVVPNDPRVGDQWALAMVNAFDAWDLETGGTDVVIGIIDSGISMTGPNLDHPDLDDTARIILGTDFVDGGTPRDTNGHGTHVAGIAAGAGNNGAGIAGMNWGARLYICRTLDGTGNGSTADFADAVEEIVDFAVANGLKAVINYSAGGGDNATRRAACEYASDNGMLVLGATGNDNAGPVIFPAAYSTSITGVIGVGSTDDDDTVSSFSNVGPEVTVVAPGRGILAPMPTYPVTIPAGPNFGELDGTSMATPLVTGLAALMWSRHPSFTNEKIKNCLKSSAVELGAGSFDNSWGHGRVDAEAALRCGDVVLPPSRIGPTCPVRSVVPATCPTRAPAGCPSAVPISCPSRIRATCPSNVPQTCPSVSPGSCPPSRLPVLCPTSRVPQQCPSQLPVLCPRPSVSPATCPVPSASPATCPVPSQVGICRPPFDPRDPVIDPRDPVIQPRDPVVRPGQPVLRPQAEQWYGEGGEYYWVDENGAPHAFAEGEQAAAADQADYYWVDDAGRTHYWSPGAR